MFSDAFRRIHDANKSCDLFESPGRYEVHDVELDPPKEHEVLVRMTASGLCHSDLHLVTGD